MTNYVGFINSMLDLRNQRLKEAIAQAEAKQKNMEAMGDAIGKGLSGLGKSMFGNKEDAMANQLMQENSAALGGPDIRRAQAVDSAVQGPADARAASMPGFYRGGMDEMKTRMAMQEMRDKSMNTRLDNQRSDAYFNMQRGNIDADNARQDAAAKRAEDEAALKRPVLLREAQDAAANAPDLTKAADQEASYLKNMRLFQHDMDNAKDPMQYKHAADAAVSLNRGAIKKGMDIQPIQIGPFMTQEQRQAIKDQETAVSEAQKSITDAKGMDAGWGMPGWIPGVTSKQESIDAAQQKYDAEQQSLKDMQGQVTPYTPPPDNAAPAGASQGGGSMQTISSQEASAKSGKPIKPGTILTDKNGNRILVN
jgi:hypothetical protein